MIFDKELCFIDEGQLTAFAGGVVGDILDLGSNNSATLDPARGTNNNQTGKGRPSYVAVACGQDMTATGDPDITLQLEFSDTEDFLASSIVPLSLPTLKKADFAAGAAVCALAPMYAKRFVRFLMNSTAELACSTITVGFVLDPQTNH